MANPTQMAPTYAASKKAVRFDMRNPVAKEKDTISEACSKIAEIAGSDSLVQLLASRMINCLTSNVMPKLVNDTTHMHRLLAFTDTKLAEEMMFMLQIDSARSSREIEKIRKRAEADKAFFKLIEENGGLYKVGEVSELTGLTRQAINKQKDNNKLIALKQGGDYFYPGFQFKHGKKLPQLDVVLSRLPRDLSPFSKTSFFITEMQFSDDRLVSPAKLLGADAEVTKEKLDEIIRQASLFGRHIAK